MRQAEDKLRLAKEAQYDTELGLQQIERDRVQIEADRAAIEAARIDADSLRAQAQDLLRQAAQAQDDARRARRESKQEETESQLLRRLRDKTRGQNAADEPASRKPERVTK